MNPLWFYACRFFTGAGIGGEYAAIDELIPARVRGRVDLIINGSFWLGTMFGAALSLVLLDTDLFAPTWAGGSPSALAPCRGWASCWSGATSPRAPLAVLHARNEEAEELVDEIEREVEEETGQPLEEVGDSIRIRQRKSIGFGVIAHTAFKRYPKRTLLGLSLFIGQAPAHDHPLLCGLWGAADRHRAAVQRRGAVGRHPDRLLGGGLLLRLGRGQRRLPDRQRDLPAGDQGDGPAFFYAVGTGVGGVTGPLLFGKLVGTERRSTSSTATCWAPC